MSLVSEVRQLLNEPAANAVKFWPDQQVYDALNEAQLDVYGEIGWGNSSATVNITSSTDMYEFPVGIMIPQRIYISPNGDELYPTTNVKLEQAMNAWRSASPAKPSHYIKFDGRNFRVWPKPDGNYTLTVVGEPYAVSEITGGSQDILGLDTQIRFAIIHRAAAILLEATQPDLADFYMGDVVEYVRNYIAGLKSTQGHNIMHLRPFTNGWEVAQLGNVVLGKRY